MSKEKPILFNTAMVQAILEGRKTQTRRIIKPQPEPCNHKIYESAEWKNEPSKWIVSDESCAFCGLCGNGINFNGKGYLKTPCKKGDILWVRETWAKNPIPTGWPYDYKASPEYWEMEEHTWKPSIHMPREAARVFLKVTDVRVERLQDITKEGAKAEGIQWITKDGTVFKYFTSYDGWEDIFRKNRKRYSGTAWQNMPKTAIEAFAKLWDSCYKWPQCWSYNPWVWVIEFEKLEGYNE